MAENSHRNLTLLGNIKFHWVLIDSNSGFPSESVPFFGHHSHRDSATPFTHRTDTGVGKDTVLRTSHNADT
jgi:hypothetical protein